MWVTRDELARLGSFLRAYDAWATSPDHIGGELFDAMLRAREACDDFGHATDEAGAKDRWRLEVDKRIRAARAEMKARCAKLAEEHAPAETGWLDTRVMHQRSTARAIAAAIRALPEVE